MKNVAAQTHFYRVSDLDQPDLFEDLLSDIEAAAQTVIKKLDQGCPLPLAEQDRADLAIFMAMQAVRGPDTRRTSELVRAKMIRTEVGAGGRANVAAWARKNLGIDPDEELAQQIWDQATQPDGPPLRYSNRAHIEFQVETAQELVRYIAGRPWAFIRFEKRSLITCDSPVSLIHHPDIPDEMGVGFATAWGIGFPLTRKLGLLATDPTVVTDEWESEDPRFQRYREGVYKGEADNRRVEALTSSAFSTTTQLKALESTFTTTRMMSVSCQPIFMNRRSSTSRCTGLPNISGMELRCSSNARSL